MTPHGATLRNSSDRVPGGVGGPGNRFQADPVPPGGGRLLSPNDARRAPSPPADSDRIGLEERRSGRPVLPDGLFREDSPPQPRQDSGAERRRDEADDRGRCAGCVVAHCIGAQEVE